MRCVALLRGINVGGRKSLKMADLKRVFESLSFKNVQTYVQSGNVIFDCKPAETAKIAEGVEARLLEVFGVSPALIIRTQNDLKRIIDNNPLVRKANTEPDKLHVTFLLDAPDETIVSKLDVTPGPGEMFALAGKEVYLYCPNGYARTRLNNAAFEAGLKTLATTRNWKTVNKLLSFSTFS